MLTTDAPTDVIAMAASAGGLRAIGYVLSRLPADCPAAILVVQHLHPKHRSFMAHILDRHTDLSVKQADDGEPIRHSVVYVAPPNRHLLVDENRRVELSDAALVHFVRPSADLLFESVAATFGDRAIGVVLTGSGVDGSIGIKAINRMHGTVLVQQGAEFDGMPSAAIHTGIADRILDLEDIPEALIELVAKRQPR
jgi:two-component system chemotaxis response regulator CheB